MSIGNLKNDPEFVCFVRETIERFARERRLVSPELTVNQVFEHRETVQALGLAFSFNAQPDSVEPVFGHFLKPRAADLAALVERFGKKSASAPAAIPSIPKAKKTTSKEVSSGTDGTGLSPDEEARQQYLLEQETLANSAIPEWVLDSPERISAFNGFINMCLNPNDKPSLRRYEIAKGPARRFLLRVVRILRDLMVASGKNPDTDKSSLFGELVARVKAGEDMGWLVPLLPVPGIPRVEFDARVAALSDPEWDPKKARETPNSKAFDSAIDAYLSEQQGSAESVAVIEQGVSDQ